MFLTRTFCEIPDLDTIDITVRTPLPKTKDPDMSYVVSACQAGAEHRGAGKRVILEVTS